MKSECTCRPGSNETHWFEVRCEYCNRLEGDLWAKAVNFYTGMIRRRKRVPVFRRDLTGRLNLVYDIVMSSAEELNSPTKID